MPPHAAKAEQTQAETFDLTFTCYPIYVAQLVTTATEALVGAVDIGALLAARVVVTLVDICQCTGTGFLTTPRLFGDIFPACISIILTNRNFTFAVHIVRGQNEACRATALEGPLSVLTFVGAESPRIMPALIDV